MTERQAAGLARAALGLLVVTGALLSERALPVVLALAAVGLLTAALLPRLGRPVPAAALLLLAAVTGLCHGDSGNVGWFALCVLTGWCVLATSTRPALVVTALSLVVLVWQATVVSPEPGWAGWVLGTLLTLAACLAGRRQLALVEQLRAAQAGLAQRARAEERATIARELHDVIAHCLTVSLLHVGSARLALQDDPAEAAEALRQAEDLGRQSLAEVRHAVGLLHEASGSRAPLPGCGQLAALVDGFRRAGAQVAYDVSGDPARLPATTGLTVYRILQESLTNAVRHGDGRPAAVRLEVGERSAVLTVDSDGRPVAGTGDGVGLHSMRERAEALGGQFSAGPSGAGWRVHAVLPA